MARQGLTNASREAIAIAITVVFPRGQGPHAAQCGPVRPRTRQQCSELSVQLIKARAMDTRSPREGGRAAHGRAGTRVCLFQPGGQAGP